MKKNYNAIKEDVTITKAAYYPKLDLALSMGQEQTTKSGLIGTQHDIETDFSVSQTSLKLTQNLFNGFATTQQLTQQNYKLLSASYSYKEKVNILSSSFVEKYIMVLKNKELLENTKYNVTIDKDMLKRVTKLFQAGLTTKSEVNKIKSSLALAQANNVVQEDDFSGTVVELENFLSFKINTTNLEVPKFQIQLPSSLEEATLYALSHNPSIIISNYNIKMAQSAYKEKQAFYYPIIDLEISKTINKNQSATKGTIDTNKIMLYLRYNLFNGFADKSALQKSISQIHQEVASINSARDIILKDLSLAWQSNIKITLQLKFLQEYLDFSIETLNLYSKEYDLGRRSLLDLLSAQNDFIGAKSQIINAKYNLLLAQYKILYNMGILVPSILKQKTIDLALHKDQLPISLDEDHDLIPDNQDICRNSPLQTPRDHYGCKYDAKEDNISVIERFNGFTFEKNNAIFSPKVQLRVKSLLHQLKPYGIENIKFEIYSNTTYKDMNTSAIEKLSEERANLFKNILIKNGYNKNQITIFNNRNKKPISIGNNILNNRLDIVVKKLRKDK